MVLEFIMIETFLNFYQQVFRLTLRKLGLFFEKLADTPEALGVAETITVLASIGLSNPLLARSLGILRTKPAFFFKHVLFIK